MKRILTLAAAAALFAVPATAQNLIQDEDSSSGFGSGMQLNKDACDKPQYMGLDECKNLMEGRSATDVTEPDEGTVGRSSGPGNDSGSGSGADDPAGADGDGGGGGAGGGTSGLD